MSSSFDRRSSYLPRADDVDSMMMPTGKLDEDFGMSEWQRLAVSFLKAAAFERREKRARRRGHLPLFLSVFSTN